MQAFSFYSRKIMAEYILLIVISFLIIYYVNFLFNIYTGLDKLVHTIEDKIIPEFISVIIPFRNERKLLPENLKTLEAQSYPNDKYEIIYVNDFSTDDSVEYLLKNKKAENIKIISVPNNYSSNAHKKRAIRFGIENAKGEIIVTTDADCKYGEDWLRSLLKYMDNKTAFVSGPVEFEDNGKYFGKIQMLEFAGLVITGAGLIGKGNPVICNAANIAYRKKIFNEVKGFSDQLKLSSGDDELLMQKIWKETDYKIRFCPEKKAVVKTAPNSTFKQFYQQRKRWASKGFYYGNKILVIKLILIFLFYLSIPVQLILSLLISPNYFIILLISLILKALSEYLVMRKGTDLLFGRKLLRPFLMAQILHIPYIIVAVISGTFGNFTWKGRKVSR